MTNREDISRIAKILARSTSSEPHEADTALRAAYKRMRRDHVDMRQLLTLPLEELYQESLTKLVTLILDEQPELSPAERRKAFQNYMALINARFIVGSARSAGAPGQAMLEALAAIEADPANPQRHMAFAWDNYRAERYEVVRAIGKFLPKIAPASSDAWLLFWFFQRLDAPVGRCADPVGLCAGIAAFQNP